MTPTPTTDRIKAVSPSRSIPEGRRAAGARGPNGVPGDLPGASRPPEL